MTMQAPDASKAPPGRVDQRDLSALKGNRFEKLKGDRAGTYSLNDQWRITFRIESNRALDVTIEDYHSGGSDGSEGERGDPSRSAHR
jgi:hypothetical protein